MPEQTSIRPTVDEMLVAATPRRRTVDEHMFQVGEAGGVPCTFRLQLFTAAGERTVAVATQEPDEGASLINRAEQYAAAVWRTHCSSESGPPIWVQQMLPDDGHYVVSFDVTGPFQLKTPEWQSLTDEQLAQLAGCDVDPSRGDGYVAFVPPPPDRLQYDIIPVADLPEPQPFREACMSYRASPLRSLLRRMRGRRPGPGTGCCWYHKQDWAAVSELAIRLVEDARRDGLADEDIGEISMERARALGAADNDLPALRSLLSPAVAISPHLGPDPGYTNGQHRARAMRDAGVKRTIVVTYLPHEDTISV